MVASMVYRDDNAAHIPTTPGPAAPSVSQSAIAPQAPPLVPGANASAPIGVHALGQVVDSTTPSSQPASNRVTVGVPSNRSQLSRQAAVNKRARFVATVAVAGLVLAVVALVVWYLSYSRSHHLLTSSTNRNYVITNVPLDQLRSEDLLIGQASQLSINGQLRLNNSFVLAPTNTPANPLLGQFYLNNQDKQLYYYNGTSYENLATGTDVTSLTSSLAVANNINAGSGLALAGNRLSNTGVLSLQGTANQVNLSAGTGSVTIGLPQDIAPNSAPSFAGLSVSSLSARPGSAGLTIDSGGQNLALQGANTVLSDTNGIFSTRLGFAAPTATNTITLPNASGTVCLVELANCTGGGSGVTTSGGTQFTVPIYNSANVIGNSIITQDAGATTVTIGGNLQVTGTASGNGSGLTNVNAAELAGQLPAFYQNASNINSGTLADARLSVNVALLNGNQTFSGSNTFSSQLNANGGVVTNNANVNTGTGTITGNGSGLTSLDGSNIATGTVADGRLSTNVTLQGNTFNGNNQLVQLTNTGILPALSGLNLTNLNASNIFSGTLADGRLSANVALLNGVQTFTGTNNFKPGTDSAAAVRIQNALGATTLFNADTTGSGALTFGVPSTFNSTLIVNSLGGAGSTAICLNGSSQIANCTTNPSGVTLQQAYNASTSPQIVLTSGKGGLVVQDASAPIGGNLLAVQSNGGGTTYLGVTASGVSVGGALTVSGNITANSSVLFNNAVNSTTAFQVQNATGANLITADTANTKLNVVGDVNVGTRFGNRLFSDDLESGGFGLWDQGISGSITADTTTVHDGKYAAKINPAGGSAAADATIAATNTGYIRVYMYISNQTSSNADLLTFWQDPSHFWTLHRSSSGVLALFNGVTDSDAATGGALGTGAWHLLEMRITTGAGTGTSQVSVDGTQVINATAQNNGSSSFNTIEIGDSNADTYTAYVDDVAVDTATTGTPSSLNVDDSFHAGGTATFGNSVLVQSTSNNATAFQVQNAGGNQVLSVNTSDNSVAMSLGNLNVEGATPPSPTLTSSSSGGSLAAGTYYYWVAAILPGGQTYAAHASPFSVATSGSISQNTLTWSAVPGATGYYIYRSTVGEGGPWYRNTLGAVTSAVDNGTNFTWSGTDYTARDSYSDLGNVKLQQGSSVCLDSSCDGWLSHATGGGNVYLADYAAGEGLVIQADSLQFNDTTGYANDFSISNSGATVFQNRVNSTTAFQIQNSSAISLLTADTTNMRLDVGAGGTATSQLYVAGQQPSSALNTTAISSSTPQDIVTNGRYMYIAEFNLSKLGIYDVSNPASPVLIGTALTLGGKPQGIAVSGKYVYAAEYNANKMQVIDVSNPNAPSIVGTVTTTNTANAVDVSGHYAYVATNSGVDVIDVSNPTAPVKITGISLSLNAFSVFVAGRYVYATTANNGANAFVKVIDTTTNTAVGSFNLSGGASGKVICNLDYGPRSVYVQGRYAYVANCGNTAIDVFDVSNPAASGVAPTKAFSTGGSAGPMALVVQGRYLYAALSTNGGAPSSVATYDISTISAMSQVGSPTSTDTGGFSIAMQGRYVYLPNFGASDFQVLDMGGAYTQQLEAGGLETGTLAVNGNQSIGGNTSIQGGLTVGQSLEVSGSLSVNNTASITTTSTTAFQVQNGSSNNLLQIDSSANAITLSGGVAGGTLTADIAGTTTAHGVCHSGASGASENVQFVACSGTAGADFAELYPSQPSVTAGDVVMPTATYATSQDGKYQVPVVAKTASAYDANEIGVVSDIDPTSDESNLTGHNVNAADHPMPVALNGRVMTKVDTENGAIAPGDYITASSTSGVGMKATAVGEVIGRALQSYDGTGTGRILVFVNPFYYDGPSLASYLQNGNSAVFSSLAVDGASSLSDLNVSGTATLSNLSVNGVSTLGDLHATGTTHVDSLAATSAAISGAVIAGTLNVSGAADAASLNVVGNATVGSLAVNGAATASSASISGALMAGTLNISGAAGIASLGVAGPATFGGDITVNGHVITGNSTSGVTTAQVQAAAGSNATVTVSGNDTLGTITLTTGTSALAAGDLIKLVFAKTYGSPPRVLISPSNNVAAGLQFYRGTTTTTGVMLDSKDVPVSNTVYEYDYFIAQ